jgi:hypothetical protein
MTAERQKSASLVDAPQDFGTAGARELVAPTSSPRLSSLAPSIAWTRQSHRPQISTFRQSLG